MTTAPQLHALQETDQALDRGRARLAEIGVQLGEDEELMSAQGVAAEKREAVNQLRSRLSDAEWSVEEVRQKATEVEGKLYGGTVRNPKELSDLAADLASLKSQVAKREDTLLSLLVEIEDAEAQLSSAEAVLTQVEAEWKQQQAALLEEKARLEPEIASLQASRDDQSPAMDTSSLRLYQLLRERHGGQVIARVERGMCQGCRITLPMSVLQKARSGTGLVQCVSCERILLVS